MGFIFFTPFFRIIPTRVGTRVLDGRRECIDWDHPHACGDKFIMRSRLVVSEGSSPRVWGQVPVAKTTPLPPGIIPTRVGTRHSPKKLTKIIRDHPHACGDKRIFVILTQTLRGSSPRVWGQGVMVSEVFYLLGIIPTRVGTSEPSPGVALFL